MTENNSRSVLLTLFVGALSAATLVYFYKIIQLILAADDATAVASLPAGSLQPALQLLVLFLAGWFLAVGLFLKWEWAERAIAALALAIMANNFHLLVKFLPSDLRFLEPHPFVFEQVALLPFGLSIWGAAVFYFAIVSFKPRPEKVETSS